MNRYLWIYIQFITVLNFYEVLNKKYATGLIHHCQSDSPHSKVLLTKLFEIGDLTNQKAAFLVSWSCLNSQAILLQYNTLKGVDQMLSEGEV